MTSHKKTAIVTGAAKRIGESIALRLAQLHYHVILHCHTSKKEADNLARLIDVEGGAASVYQCDLADEASVSQMIPEIHRSFPHLSLLVNSASIFEMSSLLDSTNDSFNRHMNINLKAPYILTREFAKVCEQGQVINLLDTDVIRNSTQHFTYLLSKKSLAEFTNMAALQLAPKIRVNGICPGLILPPAGRDPSYLKNRAQQIPTQTHGEPQDIVRAVEFFLSNPFITGQFINVDGGEHLI